MNNKLIALGAGVIGVIATAIPAFADYTVEPTLQAQLNAGVTGLGNGVLAEMGVVLPIGLGILVSIVAVMFGLRFFGRLTGIGHH